MAWEPKCRYVGISGCARQRAKEAAKAVKQGGTAVNSIALGLTKGDFLI
jgi:hypothetical protein